MEETEEIKENEEMIEEQKEKQRQQNFKDLESYGELTGRSES